MNNIKRKVPNIVKDLLDKFDGKHERLAVDLGVTSATVRNWLDGTHHPYDLALNAIIRCAKQHGVKI
jgi:DNA-binding transcriptional regulator YiaG